VIKHGKLGQSKCLWLCSRWVETKIGLDTSKNNMNKVHTSQKMYPSRWRTLRPTCLSAKRPICKCTFNITSQNMHNVLLSFLIYLLSYFKHSYLLNRSELDPRVCDIFDSASALEFNPEILTLTPVTLCTALVWTSSPFLQTTKALRESRGIALLCA
jgi:hypothetical protein